jgi:hypothetical protein
LMLKQDNPDWGCERISSMLMRGPALLASPQAVARVLHEGARAIHYIGSRLNFFFKIRITKARKYENTKRETLNFSPRA